MPSSGNGLNAFFAYTVVLDRDYLAAGFGTGFLCGLITYLLPSQELERC